MSSGFDASQVANILDLGFRVQGLGFRMIRTGVSKTQCLSSPRGFTSKRAPKRDAQIVGSLLL